jgi:peptidoglycan hydrolase-like protein with peptidoglycan-binding domain
VPKDIVINNHTINADLDTVRVAGADIGARVPWGGAIPQNAPLSIVAIQMLLNKAGQTPPLATDGFSGPLTKNAIIASKQKHGLPADTTIDWVNWVPLLCADAGVRILPPGPAPLTS